MKTTKDLRPILRRLANLLSETAECVRTLVNSYEDESPTLSAQKKMRVERATSPPPPAPTAPAPWSWEAVVEASIEILQEAPDHTWRWEELGATLRARGATLPSWRGVNERLITTLKQRGVIKVRGGKKDRTFHYRRAITSPPSSDTASPSTKRSAPAPAPARKPRAKSAGTSPPRTNPAPWDELVRLAKAILEDQVGQRWSGAQLCQSLRDRGVNLASWKGVPFGLTGRLHTQRVVEWTRKDGTFLVLKRDAGASTPEEPSPPVTAPALDPVDTSPTRPFVADPDDGDDIHGLVEEVEAVAPYLFELPHRQVTSQICLWAGRARRIEESLGNRLPELASTLKRALRVITHRLLELKRTHKSGWVDALSSEWTTDWDIYIAYHQAIVGGYEPELTHEQEQVYHRDILRGLFHGPRKVGRVHAHRAMHEALPLLPEGDIVASKAIQMFGRPPERRVDESGPPPYQRRGDHPQTPPEPVPEVRRDLPDDLLAFTRGKRVLIAGGQGAREAHREAIQDSFGLAEVEWVTTERGKGSPFNRLEERMRPGRYDLVLFLVSHSSHQSGGFVKACKDASIPLVFLPRGYSVTSVALAISQQLLARRTPEWMRTDAPTSAN